MCPTSRELEPAQRGKLVARLNGLFGGILAKESFILSQPFYFGAVAKLGGYNPEHKVEIIEGDFIDLRADLDAGAIGQRRARAPRGNGAGNGAQPHRGAGNGDGDGAEHHQPPDGIIELLEQDAGEGLSQDPDDLPEPASPEKIKAALAAIDPDIDRASWFAIGCALFKEFGDEGFAIWNAWSKQGEKYKAREMVGQWRSIVQKTGYDFTIGTVFYFANRADPDWCTRAETVKTAAETPETIETAAEMVVTTETVETTAKTTKKPDQPQQQKQSKSRAVTIRASEVKMRAKKWLWKGHLLRAALELLAGVPGIGKSQVQILYVACVTNPKKCPWPDGTMMERPSNVVMVTAEDALDQEVVPRLIAAGADLDRVTFVKSIRVVVDKTTKKRQFILTEEDLIEVEKTINEIGDVALVTIDPITAFMGGKLDSHKATEVRSQLGPLKDFAERNEVAVSAITHPAKNTSQRAIDQFIGSQAFIAAARIGHVCIEELEEEEDDGKVKMVKTGRILFCHAKHNPSIKMPTWAFGVGSMVVGQDPDTHEIIDAPYVVFDKEPVATTADEAVAMAAGGRGSGGRGGDRRSEESVPAQKFLARLLKDKSMNSTEVFKRAEEAKFTRDQMYRAKTKLGVRATKAGFSGGWDWHLSVPLEEAPF